MKHYEISFKEVGSDYIGYTAFIGDKTRQEVIDWLDLEKDDIEWYGIKVTEE